MIFFAEETIPKAGKPEAEGAEPETSAQFEDLRPAAAESPSSAQPGLFAGAEADAPTDSSAGEAAAPAAAASESESPPSVAQEPAAETGATASVVGAEAKDEETAAAVTPPAVTPPAVTPAARPAAVLPEVRENRAVIKVVGIGGGGGNAVNRMIEAGVTGVEFIAANTDAQVLELSRAPVKIQLGSDRTGGLGCGGDPEVGRLAARDDISGLIEVLAGADMVFITVGEGGGTGTGAAPVIACVVQEIKALCVAVVTKPMTVEGRRRKTTANDGIRELREFVDTLICVPNDRVVEVYGNLKIRDAFRAADDVVRQAVQGISDLIQVPGEINLDFADVRTAMRLRGDAVMGIGRASGENRVQEATESAISSPLLEDTSIEGATSIIVNVTGGESLTLNEVQCAVEVVRTAVSPETPGILGTGDSEPADNILIGTALDPTMDETGEIKVTVVATGFPDRNRVGATPHKFPDFTNRATGTFDPRGAAPGAGSSRPAVQAAAARSERVGRKIPKLNTFPAVADSGANRAEARAGSAAAGPDGGAGVAARGGSTRVVVDEPMPLPADAGDDRWGDLDTPPFLQRRR